MLYFQGCLPHFVVFISPPSQKGILRHNSSPLPQKGTPMPAEHVFAAEEEEDEEEGAIAAFNPLRRRAAAPFGEIIYF